MKQLEIKKNSLVINVHNDGVDYRMRIDTIDDEAIACGKQTFEEFKVKGIIKCGAYNDDIWTISNEVTSKTVKFDFSQFSFDLNVRNVIGQTYDFVCNALRTFCVIKLQQGTALTSIPSVVNAVRTFLDSGELPESVEALINLENFLLLLPGEPLSKLELLQDIANAEANIESNKGSDNKRTMADYKSYLLFDNLLKDYWERATASEKCVYFPVWFWWNITGVLPLRPTCIVLTPRNCIQEHNGKKYLTVRRTKLKKKGGSRYSILNDYNLCKYRITDQQYAEIKKYIEMTKDNYQSDIDVLFSKAAQFEGFEIAISNDNHYTYANLNQCLRAFYKNVIVNTYKMTAIEKSSCLRDGEIEKISLGDTRVFSMINLFLTGNSAVVCKELAGHDWIDMGDHYYSNLKSFLDTLSFSVYRPEANNTYSYWKKGLVKPIYERVPGGYCSSEEVRKGDFSLCARAANMQGNIGDCRVCRCFIPNPSEASKLLASSDESYNRMFHIVKAEIEAIHNGIGSEESLEAKLKLLQNATQQYVFHSVLNQYLREEEIL